VSGRIDCFKHLALAAGFCGILLGLTGCSAVAPAYQPSIDNTRALQQLPDRKVSVGTFTARTPELNHISLRGGAFNSPFNDSYAEYLKAALRSELESAGKLDSTAQVTITGELLENALDAAIGTGTARISARIMVTRGKDKVFDKIVVGTSSWDSSFMGAVAIPAARQNYADTMKKLLAQLFSDPDFRAAL
jgi:hypothetical protein